MHRDFETNTTILFLGRLWGKRRNKQTLKKMFLNPEKNYKDIEGSKPLQLSSQRIDYGYVLQTKN